MTYDFAVLQVEIAEIGEPPVHLQFPAGRTQDFLTAAKDTVDDAWRSWKVGKPMATRRR